MGTDGARRSLRKRWDELTGRQRAVLVATGLFEAFAKVAMLRDLRRRPAEQIRGPRLLWGATALVNTAGLAQVAYFMIGRRRST